MYTLYNTGDQVWSEWRDGKWVTTKVITHDGIISDEREEGGIVHLTGFEKALHSVQVKVMRALYAVLYR